MKKQLLIIVLLFGTLVHSQTASSLFSKANGLYKNGNYKEAIALYSKIEEQGLVSADLYYNLGNSYYKLNEVAPSIYYYEKALKLNPAHADALANLTFAKRMTIDAIEELPKTFLQRFSKNVIEAFSFDTWALIAVIASFFIAILFLLYRFSVSSKKKLFFFNATILSAFVFIVTLFFAFKSESAIQKNRAAIIFAEKTAVKNAPSVNGDDIFELHEGTKVIILDELDSWKKIKIADGKVGWIGASNLKEI